jgi:hypothetical protein
MPGLPNFRAQVLLFDLDAVVADHEAWHALAAFRNGMHLYDVNADRRGKVDGYGHVWFYPDKDDDRPWPVLAAAEAVVYLAPEVARAYRDEAELAQDRRQVKELWASLGSPPGWIDARRADALAFVTDPENRKRFTRFARELIDRGSIPGPEAEAFLEVWGSSVIDRRG